MASMAKTCQFAYPDDYLELHELEFMRWPEHVVPWWLVEMDDFIDYFLREADQQIDEGDLTEGIRHLTSACRIISHLSRDPGVPSSMVAGLRCLDVLDRIEPLIAQEPSPEQRTLLREALRDPLSPAHRDPHSGKQIRSSRHAP
mgnify:CR=1 FL=1